MGANLHLHVTNQLLCLIRWCLSATNPAGRTNKKSHQGYPGDFFTFIKSKLLFQKFVKFISCNCELIDLFIVSVNIRIIL